MAYDKSPTGCPFCASTDIEFKPDIDVTVTDNDNIQDEQTAAYFECNQCGRGLLVWHPDRPIVTA